MIKVNELKVEFKDGMTVSNALKEAGKTIDNMTLVMLNGKVLYPEQFESEKLIDGAHIKVLTLVSGG